VVGHTDNAGGFDYNRDLSQRRAEAVVTRLIQDQGVDVRRLFPVGVSFAAPIASNQTEEGRAQNRRVELVRY
jgi:outer membrane protein OmpA-like peptidoglycan-associated protein